MFSPSRQARQETIRFEIHSTSRLTVGVIPSFIRDAPKFSSRSRRVGTFFVPTRIRQHPLEVTAKKFALAKSPYCMRHLFLLGGSLAPRTQPLGHKKRAPPTLCGEVHWPQYPRSG